MRTWVLVGPLLALGVACDSGSSDVGSGTETDMGSTSGTPTTDAPTSSPGTTSTSSGTTTDVSTTEGDSSSGGSSSGGGESSSGSTGAGFIGSPGCGTAATLLDGEHTFTLDGYDRRYVLRLPENYDPEQPWPLIFALHGNGGNPGYWDELGGDRDIRTAFAQEAILVIPEAINNAWRDYDADPETWPMLMDLELGYFDTILDAVSNDLCIHPEQIFSMGFSGGGSYSGVLGCRRDYIRAIAVGGSVIYFDEQDCVETPAAWVTIGDGELSEGREAFRDFFREHAGCQPESTPAEPEGCVAYEGCGLDTPVRFCGHPAGHVWPSIGTDAAREFLRQFYTEG